MDREMPAVASRTVVRSFHGYHGLDGVKRWVGLVDIGLARLHFHEHDQRLPGFEDGVGARPRTAGRNIVGHLLYWDLIALKRMLPSLAWRRSAA
jgi:hypothetical protein